MASRIFLAVVAVLFALSAAPSSHAQDYPNRPVTLVVPWPAGGTTDIGMRALASATEKYLKQKIVIENRPGAAGVLGLSKSHRTQPPTATPWRRSRSQCSVFHLCTEPR